MSSEGTNVLPEAKIWIQRTGWIWEVIGGFFLIAYLFWYIPALANLPKSLRDPPEPYPWHWTLDFTATAMAGVMLLYLGFRRAFSLAAKPASEDDATDR